MQLTNGQRLDFERCVIFLHSDCEFERPPKRLGAGVADYFRRVLDEITFRRFHLWSPQVVGDVSVWPFFRQAEYERALKSPRLLKGRMNQCAPASAVSSHVS